jgi:predicted amidohydrolase YtcJ
MKTLAMFLMAAAATAALAQDPCAGSRDVRLVNGSIHTMDAQNRVVREATVQNGRLVAVGRRAAKTSPCTQTIDLKGRTVVPGLIDNHNHIVLLGLRPGYDTRLERAGSVAEVQALIRERARTVPAGAFITAMGGWNVAQFAERRFPTLAELDAAGEAHPVMLFQAFNGPAAVNSAAKRWLESKGVAVAADGALAANANSMAALNALRQVQTFEDKKRGTADAMAYAARLGLTTSVDMGAFAAPGTEDLHGEFSFDTLASANPYRMFDAFLALNREGKLASRLRIFFLSMDTAADVPVLRNRLQNAFDGFGDDMLKVAGIGEFATNWPLFGAITPPPNYETALQLVAKHGWAFQQHTLSLAEDQLSAATFEKVNATTPIANLRWSVAHSPRIDAATMARLKAVGAGIAIHPFQYLAGTIPAGATFAGPPVKSIVESGIKAGAGSDSAQISTLNPWLMIYYMVTGKNAAGALVNPGQQISRQEALRLYTRDNGWFLKEEADLGSIEEGKWADLVVLNKDYFDPRQVSDEQLKDMAAELTMVGGRVVYRKP